MHLFLIRHGESETNANWREDRENHEMNSHLTERGRQQAKGVAEWMKSKIPQLDGLYASTLIRTQQTVSYFEDAYQMQAVFDDRIREGGYSYRSAAPIEDHLLPIRKDVGFHLNPFNPFALEPEGVESFADMRQRVGSFLHEVIDKHSVMDEDGLEVGGQVVCVVIHGWTLNAFTDLIFNVPQRRSCYVNAANTSISYFEYVNSTLLGPWRMNFMNMTPHMEVFEDGFGYKGEES
jgi:broad specificity phosphatase PhoE